jgi:hypothetical protein
LGLALCVILLVLGLVNPRAALGGWLVAFVACYALPLGALTLAMIMALTPGRWVAVLRGPSLACLPLLAPLTLAFLPIALGLGILYPWTAIGGVYLSPLFFILRSVLFFVLMLWLARALLRSARPGPIAAAGLIALTLANSVIAVDWLMSLTPEFHSSGFGLYVFGIEVSVALAVLVLLVLQRHRPDTPTGPLGGLLLTILLLGLYLGFMQYFIIWSGDLPQGVVWYQQRSGGVWNGLLYLSAGLQMACTFALLFAPLRQRAGPLGILAWALLVAKLIEIAWIVLPSLAVDPGVAVAFAAVAICALGIVSWALLPYAAAFAALLRPDGERKAA